MKRVVALCMIGLLESRSCSRCNDDISVLHCLAAWSGARRGVVYHGLEGIHGVRGGEVVAGVVWWQDLKRDFQSLGASGEAHEGARDGNAADTDDDNSLRCNVESCSHSLLEVRDKVGEVGVPQAVQILDRYGGRHSLVCKAIGDQ